MTKATVISKRQRRAVLRVHKELGNWRAVQDYFKVSNVSYVFNFGVHGIEPVNLEARYQLGLDVRPKPEWLKGAVRWLAKREKDNPQISQITQIEPNRKCYTRQGKLYMEEER